MDPSAKAVPASSSKPAPVASGGGGGDDGGGGDYGFRTSYVHYRTGKVMKAADYGYTSWPPFGKKK